MRNNAAYLPENPIVYIIFPESIHNRASFPIFAAIQLNLGKDENETDCLCGAADGGMLRKSVGPKGRGDENRSETRPGDRSRGPRHCGWDECERGAGQPPLVARICGRAADARRAFGRGVGRRRHQPPRHGPPDGSFGAGALSGACLCVFRRGRLSLRRPDA